MRSAIEAVLSTTELLESILHKLPMKDLLFAQAVSKHWKATIDNSPKLQRALFLRPIDLETLTVKWDCKHGLMNLDNSLIWGTGLNGKLRWTTKKHRALPVYENPLLRETIAWLQNPLSTNKPNWLQYEKHGGSSTSVNGSWSRMLLTQPAVEASWSPYRIYCKSGCGVVKIDTRKHRLRDVLQTQHELCKECYAGLTGAEIWQDLIRNERIEELEPAQKSSKVFSELCAEGVQQDDSLKRTLSTSEHMDQKAPTKAGLLSYSFI